MSYLKRAIVSDPTTVAAQAEVTNVTPGATDYGLVVRLVPEDFYFRVAAGTITGMSAVNKFGMNMDVDTATVPEDIWSRGGVWVKPTQARQHAIVSTDAKDDSAGTGARTVRIYGLTAWTTAQTSEDVTMDGTTPVNTSGSYVIIHRMQCLTFGTDGTNAGTITATAATDATVTAEIAIGKGQTLMAIYGIPSTQTAYMTGYYISVNRSAVAVTADMDLLVNEAPNAATGGFVVKHDLGLNTVGSSYLPHQFNPPLKISGPAIIKLSAANVSANDTNISAGFDLVLVTN